MTVRLYHDFEVPVMVIAPVYGMKGLLSSSLFICRYAHKSLPFVSFDMKMPPSEISSTGLFTGASAANARRGSSPRHYAPSFPPRRVISRPICSLVADRASSTPLTFPPQRTRIRSHSSSSTSRSSPT